MKGITSISRRVNIEKSKSRIIKYTRFINKPVKKTLIQVLVLEILVVIYPAKIAPASTPEIKMKVEKISCDFGSGPSEKVSNAENKAAGIIITNPAKTPASMAKNSIHIFLSGRLNSQIYMFLF
jgi:hypothetical protein